MASSVWWCIVSLTWFLAAGLKWGSESISHYRLYFHLTAWSLPLIQTLAILAQSLVDADPLTGLCGVGNLRVQTLRLYLLTPSTAYLLVGITFLAAGFVSLFRIRTLLIRKQQQRNINGESNTKKAHKLEKLMIRIGVFSILYTVPATCVIACQFYEHVYRDEWEKTAICRNLGEDVCSTSTSSYGLKPAFAVFVLKYFMSLVVGVTSGFWIWTGKSFNSWRVFFLNRRFCFLPSSNNKLTPNSSECTTENGVHCCSFRVIRDCLGCERIGTTGKDSVVYFQANDGLNKPNLYDLPQAYASSLNDDDVEFVEHQQEALFFKPSGSRQFNSIVYAHVPSSCDLIMQNQQAQFKCIQHVPFYEYSSTSRVPSHHQQHQHQQQHTTTGSSSSSQPSTISTLRR